MVSSDVLHVIHVIQCEKTIQILYQGLKASATQIITVVLAFFVICTGIFILQMSKVDPRKLEKVCLAGCHIVLGIDSWLARSTSIPPFFLKLRGLRWTLMLPVKQAFVELAHSGRVALKFAHAPPLGPLITHTAAVPTLPLTFIPHTTFQAPSKASPTTSIPASIPMCSRPARLSRRRRSLALTLFAARSALSALSFAPNGVCARCLRRVRQASRPGVVPASRRGLAPTGDRDGYRVIGPLPEEAASSRCTRARIWRRA